MSVESFITDGGAILGKTRNKARFRGTFSVLIYYLAAQISFGEVNKTEGFVIKVNRRLETREANIGKRSVY